MIIEALGAIPPLQEHPPGHRPWKPSEGAEFRATGLVRSCSAHLKKMFLTVDTLDDDYPPVRVTPLPKASLKHDSLLANIDNNQLEELIFDNDMTQPESMLSPAHRTGTLEPLLQELEMLSLTHTPKIGSLIRTNRSRRRRTASEISVSDLIRDLEQSKGQGNPDSNFERALARQVKRLSLQSSIITPASDTRRCTLNDYDVALTKEILNQRLSLQSFDSLAPPNIRRYTEEPARRDITYTCHTLPEHRRSFFDRQTVPDQWRPDPTTRPGGNEIPGPSIKKLFAPHPALYFPTGPGLGMRIDPRLPVKRPTSQSVWPALAPDTGASWSTEAKPLTPAPIIEDPLPEPPAIRSGEYVKANGDKRFSCATVNTSLSQWSSSNSDSDGVTVTMPPSGPSEIKSVARVTKFRSRAENVAKKLGRRLHGAFGRAVGGTMFVHATG